MEHHANIVPWQQAAQEHGAMLRYLPLTADGQLDLSVLDNLLGPRTKIMAVTAISNVLGTVNPIARIVRRAHDVGAVALVNGAQNVPHQYHGRGRAWNVDFLAFSGHKMLGPNGVGVLMGGRHCWRQCRPFSAAGT